MSDIEQAAYNAISQRIGHPDIAGAVERVARSAFDISGYTSRLYGDASLAIEHWAAAGREQLRPFMLLRPRMLLDGNQWCALYGDNLHDGVAGFGDTPAKASLAFDMAWLNETPNVEANRPKTAREEL